MSISTLLAMYSAEPRKTIVRTMAKSWPLIASISGQDFAIVRTMVFLGSALYIASNVLIDIAYTWVDPRVRLS